MQTKIGFTALVLSLAAAAVMAAPALAEERTCRGTLGAVTVDNLRVPQGATCVLNGTRIKGTLKVERGATLKAAGVRVVGNVQAEGALRVKVASSHIGGSIQIVQGRHSTVTGNAVKGDIQYFSNRGAISITRNRVNGNLQCKQNSPRPTGGGNIVQGNKEDQCARL
jgi:hypothetical protein